MPARLHHWQGFLQELIFYSNQRGFGFGENKFVEENNAFYTQKVNVDDFKTPTEVMVVALHQALLNYASAKDIALPDVLKNVLNYSRSFALDEIKACSDIIDEGFKLFKSELEEWQAWLEDLKDARDLTCCHYLKCARAILDIILFPNGNHDKFSSAAAERYLESKVSKELIPFIYGVVKTMPANKVQDQLLEIMSSIC